MSENKPSKKLEVGESFTGILMFDKPLTGDGPYGPYNMYTFNIDGTEFVHYASENAHNTLTQYKKGDLVKISHIRKKDGNSVYVVDLVGSVGDDMQNKTSVYKNTDTDLAIKWGMAFNNATRLVSSLPLHNDEGDLKSRVKVIKSIMPEMFSIACRMPAQKQVNEDDLPF